MARDMQPNGNKLRTAAGRLSFNAEVPTRWSRFFYIASIASCILLMYSTVRLYLCFLIATARLLCE